MRGDGVGTVSPKNNKILGKRQREKAEYKIIIYKVQGVDYTSLSVHIIRNKLDTSIHIDITVTIFPDRVPRIVRHVQGREMYQGHLRVELRESTLRQLLLLLNHPSVGTTARWVFQSVPCASFL